MYTMDNDDKINCQLAETYFSSSSSSTASAMSESSSTEDSASSSSGDGEEDDDLLLFPLMLYLTSGQRRHRIQNYLQIIDSWTNKEYKQHLRLNRCTASKLIDELELSNFIPSHSFGVKPISAKLSFLLFFIVYRKYRTIANHVRQI
ncbi:uncharacterized protein LOC112459159 [Temnothorax curvispinosus]|uniref:Uncharacterized protein LOC112459159 n=1 Tax=Temnothorax curvispinosus TaxID=300111 RepID=A0A6J1QC54_9HYME|nr:uncharacterized protein LOC112459159 [Temnothorax curvispinosus]